MTAIVHVFVATMPMVMNSLLMRWFACHFRRIDLECIAHAFAGLNLHLVELSFGRCAFRVANLHRFHGSDFEDSAVQLFFAFLHPPTAMVMTVLVMLIVMLMMMFFPFKSVLVVFFSVVFFSVVFLFHLMLFMEALLHAFVEWLHFLVQWIRVMAFLVATFVAMFVMVVSTIMFVVLGFVILPFIMFPIA